MKNLITLAVFDNIFDVKYNLLKNLLEEAGINYFTTNEYARTVKPLMFSGPSNICIEIKVYEDCLEEASAILNSINK